ncbi:MAG: type II toxin-antitoxin system HicB family antitoxin [Candidatus Accumulibacter phosphatis]|uniref:type II toxin-antitoxin system HicB family antitoxin n=1 Tax=Accumulibacter sp. TaxID=2053492 RepID=UPI000AE63617|nr:type II toxin-antitoxin system HicB family antitoxin [Accumulibacter sp.]MCQ1550456.1 type II toxin-antitoxin system HicB family antitoxin [Candidatus Accumulibacter phosphatis]HNG55395.1 type II toxin-antitoxin system HicB family antitoxin [Nitrospira sp.]HNL90618.1 type II toxin-antitoxin system HicB family antitoxin [Nitrospira sp.]HNO72580.1 type II toxin-antitoxin system HicB family antitoxin [Accumulibacter sp.]
MDILKYKDYEGTAELDMSRRVCRGKILFIDDLVTYEAASPAELQTEFEAAVDDYIDTCATLGREPQKPLRGQFNVRVPPALHKAAALRALAENVSLNDVAVRALDAFVNIHSVVSHNVRVTLDIPEESLKTLVSSASTQTQWGTAHVH